MTRGEYPSTTCVWPEDHDDIEGSEIRITKKTGILKDVKVRAFRPEYGDAPMKFGASDNSDGVTQKMFHEILDKASQLMKHETKSDQEKS